MSESEATTAREAVETALQIHDGMRLLISEDELPAGAIEPAQGFIAALHALGWDVTRFEFSRSTPAVGRDVR